MLCDVSFLALLMLYWLRALDTAGRSPNGEHFERDPLWFWAPKAALVLALWSASLWLYTTERLEKSVDPTYALTLIQPLFNSHSTLSWLHRYDALVSCRVVVSLRREDGSVQVSHAASLPRHATSCHVR